MERVLFNVVGMKQFTAKSAELADMEIADSSKY